MMLPKTAVVRIVAAAATLAGIAAAGAAYAGAGENHGDAALASEARISLEQAQRIALGARPGEVREWELEREAGGSGLRYSFDIADQSGVYEVGVDARDGAVLENERDGEADED